MVMGHISIFRRSSLVPALSRSIAAFNRRSVRLLSSLKADIGRHLESVNAHSKDWAPLLRGRLRSLLSKVAKTATRSR
jgi:hypothetical protein